MNEAIQQVVNAALVKVLATAETKNGSYPSKPTTVSIHVGWGNKSGYVARATATIRLTATAHEIREEY